MSSSSPKNSTLQTVLDLLGEYIDSIDFATPEGKVRNDEATEELCQKLKQGVPFKTAFATLEIVFKINKLKKRMEDFLLQRKNELLDEYEKALTANEEKANETSKRWIGSFIVAGTLLAVLSAGVWRLCMGNVTDSDCLCLFLLTLIPCALWYILVKDPTLLDRFTGLWKQSEKKDSEK